jgi:hypothetical protein
MKESRRLVLLRIAWFKNAVLSHMQAYSVCEKEKECELKYLIDLT